MEIHRYTPEEDAFLRRILPGRHVAEIVDLFNARFDSDVSFNSIKAAIKNRKLSSGLDCRFKPGITSYAPQKGSHLSPKTEFKKGHKPANWKPVGSERVNVYGYIEVKVEEPRKWRQKHHVVWEAANGPIPHNHVILFADGNGQNIDLDNLILVSRGQMAVLNKHNLLHQNRDGQITKNALLTADLIAKLTQLKKKNA